MKIAIDARNINSSTGRYVERLIHYLEEIDQENEYFILVPQKDISYYKPQNKHFKIIAATFDDYSLQEQISFLRFLNALNVDLVHFSMPQQPILYRKPHVTTVHDLILFRTYNSDKNYLIYHFKQLIGRFVFYIVGHSSKQIICPTEYTKREYARFAHINPDKITVTYEAPGIATDDEEPYKPMVGRQFLLYIGQQSDYKNIRRLMQAHQKLRTKHPDLLLVLVGRLGGKNGPPLLINKEWAQKQDFEGIIYTDFIPDSEMLWLLRHCQAYVFPSLMEGFGLPGLEAMIAGAPLVSSNATVMPEVYQDGAYYFDPTSIEDMTQKIDDVLSNTQLRTRLIKRSQEIVRTYSWKRMATQTHEVYMKALQKKN